MAGRDPLRWAHRRSLALLVVAAGCGGEASGPPVPLVDDAVVERALLLSRPTHLQLGDEIRFFESRLVGQPDDGVALRRIHSASMLRARAYGRTEDGVRAEDTLRRLQALRSDDPWVWSARAAADLSNHRFQSAVTAAEAALSAASGSDATEAARLRLFDAYVAVGRYDDAEIQLGLVRDRRGFQSLVREARLLDRSGLVEPARDRLETAMRLARASAQPRLVQAWALVELGHFEHHSGSPDRAVARYLTALETAPGYGAALEGLAHIAYAVDGDLARAEQLFGLALAAGQHLDLYLPLMEIARGRSDERRAREYRDRFLVQATATDEAEALFRRPLSLVLAEGDAAELERALDYGRRDVAERRTPESLAVYAWLLHRTGNPGEASVLFEQALEWGVPEPLVFELAGLAALERGHLELGRELLDQALDAESEIGPVRVERIRAALSQ